MQHLKLVPKFARLLSHDRLQFRSLATSSPGGRGDGVSRGGSEDGIEGAGNRKRDDADFLSKYLQDGAASDEQFLDRFFHDDSPQQQRPPNRDMGRQPRFGASSRGGGRGGGWSSGRGSWTGRTGPGRGASGVRGGRGGRGFIERPRYQDEIPANFVRDEEEDKKLKEALAQELEKKEKEKVAVGEEEEEEEEEEVRSMYTGFIDPKYDDLLKEHKQHLKRLRYKDKTHLPVKFADEDEDETLLDLDKDSDDEPADRRGRQGATNVRGRAVASSDEDDSDKEDEVDEKEWEAISNMLTTDLEKHTKHREHAKVLKKEYMARIDALGQKVSDTEEVRKVQDIILRKWRQHYNIPRLVTPLEKEEMWEKHKKDPQEWTVEKLAEKYNVCRARVHAILWLWDLRKEGGEVKSAEEETKEYLDGLAFDSDGETCTLPHMGEDKWVTPWTTRPNYKIMPEDWEGSVRSEEEAIEEASAKEEAMMLEELKRRIEFNKLQMAGFVKQHPHSRRRPPGGWTYLVEKLGPEGKRGKRGGFRFVATANGEHRNLNDFEKLMLKREAVRPRRRIL